MEVELDLKEGCELIEISVRIKCFDEFFKRKILIGKPALHGFLHLLEKRREGKIWRDRSAENEGIDEEADESSGLGAVPVCDLAADDDVGAGTVAMEERLEGSEEKGEKADLLLTCHYFQLF